MAPALTALLQTGDIKSLSYTTEELALSGDSAWQILRFRVTVQPAGTSSIVADSGGAFALWIRDSTGGKIHRDILNSSVPLPVPPRP